MIAFSGSTLFCLWAYVSVWSRENILFPESQSQIKLSYTGVSLKCPFSTFSFRGPNSHIFTVFSLNPYLPSFGVLQINLISWHIPRGPNHLFIYQQYSNYYALRGDIHNPLDPISLRDILSCICEILLRSIHSVYRRGNKFLKFRVTLRQGTSIMDQVGLWSLFN